MSFIWFQVERVSQRRGKEDGHTVKSVKNKDKGLLYDYDLEEQQAICIYLFSPFISQQIHP